MKNKYYIEISKTVQYAARLLPIVVIALGCLAQNAAAQETYPNKTVQIIDPFSAGGPGDTVTRIVADGLAKRTGQPFIVQNRVGAGGAIGPADVARSTPDGYTWGFVASGFVYLDIIYPHLPFKPATDLVPLALLCSVPYIMLARKDAPFKTVAEFVKYAKAHPGTVTYASAGVGTMTGLLAKWFSADAGVSLNQIPYGGDAPAINSILARQVDVYFGPQSADMPYVRSGKVLALATTGPTRSKMTSNIPTLMELGYHVDGVSWFGLVVPKGVPKEIMEKAHEHINAVLADNTVKQRLVAMGYEVEPTTMANFTSFMASQRAVLGKLVKDNHITAQ